MLSPVLQLRVALTAEDYDRIVALYTEGLGLEPAALWTSETTHAVLLEMGRATLEIFDEGHAAEVDRIEVGERVSGQIRFALQVPDVEAAARRLIAKGATLVQLRAEHPDAPRVQKMLDGIGLDLRVSQASAAAIIATIDSPRGRVELR